MKRLLIIALTCFFAPWVFAQMPVGDDILYGNEWIDYNQPHLKVDIEKDGIYAIPTSELESSFGLPSDYDYRQLELFQMGQPISFTFKDNALTFYAYKNRGALDRFLYLSPEDQTNPEYSLFNDFSAVFIRTSNQPSSWYHDAIVTDLTNNNLEPEAYFWYDETIVVTENYYKPNLGSNVRFSHFVAGEGYGSRLRNTNTLNFEAPGVFEDGPGAQVSVRFSGNSNGHRTVIAINNEDIDTLPGYSGNVVNERSYTVDPLELENGLDLDVKGILFAQDFNLISTGTLQYPRSFDLSMDTSLHMTFEPSDERRLIQCNMTDAENALILDLNRNQYINPIFENGMLSFFVEPSQDTITYFITTQLDEATFESIEFPVIDLSNKNYIILSSKKLRGEDDVVQAYADYRSSTMGGGYDVAIVEVEDLYNQFAYGIDQHIIALRNFNFWLVDRFGRPDYMFILGKGREYTEFRYPEQLAELTDFYVPTFGNPGADNMLAASGYMPTPIFPIGRLAAKNKEEVRWYLDKVIEHDQNRNKPQAIDEKLWMKNVLHLSGGDANIQAIIANNLSIMEDTLEQNMFGADVTTFYKKSTDPIETAVSDQIFYLINQGTSIITFFGHSSVGTFDFSLDNVQNYENKGKYPLFFSLGCFSGNIHTPQVGVSEEFVVQDQKGAIAFIASSGNSFLGDQYRYGREYYRRLGREDYGQPIGDIYIHNIETFTENLSLQNFGVLSFLQQLTFHGDPAIRMLQFDAPDYIVDASSIKTDPTFIDTYQDSFEFCYEIANLGRAERHEIDVQVTHINPNQEIETDTVFTIDAPLNTSSFCITLPVKGNQLVGKNTIKVIVDVNNAVSESPSPEAELNNVLVSENGEEGYSFFILNNSAVPVFPENYAIVNTPGISLYASTFNGFGEPQSYILELDTTKNFDSPLKRTHLASDTRGLIQWDLDFPLETKTVYYWRVSPDPQSTSVGFVWSNSSFTYDPQSDLGWNQSHFYQMQESDFNNIRYEGRNQRFVNNVKEVKLLNKIHQTGFPVTLFLNGGYTDIWRRNIRSGIAVLVFDPVTSVSWRTGGEETYGNVNTNGRDQFFFEFNTTTEADRANVINFLTEVIPDGYNVMVVTVQQQNFPYNLDEWDADTLTLGTSIFKVLENEGAALTDKLRSLGPIPYTIAYEKGNNNVRKEVLAEADPLEGVEAVYQIISLWDNGTITSPLIGPAKSWDRLEWNYSYSEVPENDTISLEIIGINRDNQEVSLFSDIQNTNIDLTNIDASTYPYLKTRFYSKDILTLSTAQLDRISAYYEGLPDLVINPGATYVLHDTLLDEGDRLRLQVGVTNLSNTSIGETSIAYNIIDNQNKSTLYQEPLVAIEPGATKTTNFSLGTRGLKDIYTLQMDINPQQSPEERNYFNNFGLFQFRVKPDLENPLLDVTFDGVQIMDQDIVSAQPLIQIELNDNNPFLLLDDPSLFSLEITDPVGGVEIISADDPSLTFFPAESADDNSARIEYRPSFELDGTYRLSVAASDISENESGAFNYEVNFRVFNREMVSDVFNYPNPFSTSTQFIFTLTGNEMPQNVLIRIMTITGKVVREITQEELGPLRIGLNRTTFKWDGTDEFGDRLANGVYLYQVVTKKQDGSDYERFVDPEGVDTQQFFTEGFGKMVIMR